MSRQRYRLAVGLSAMRDSDDQDKQFFAIDNIEDAVFSHPEPSPTRKPAIQWRARVRMFAEGINGAANALSARLGDSGKFLSRPALHPY